MCLFVMLLFLNRNALDRSAKHLISNLASHTNDRSMVYCNERESVDGTRFQTEPCCTLKSICFSLYGGQKREMCTVHKQGEKHPRATKWKQDTNIAFCNVALCRTGYDNALHSHKTGFVNTNLAYLLYSNNFPCFAVKK